MTISLVGLGVYLSIRGKLWQFFHFKECIRYMRSGGKDSDYKKSGKISGVKALSIACGAAIGVGNSNKFFQLLRHYNKTVLKLPDKSPDEIVPFSQTKLPYEEKDAAELAAKKAAAGK